MTPKTEVLLRFVCPLCFRVAQVKIPFPKSSIADNSSYKCECGGECSATVTIDMDSDTDNIGSRVVYTYVSAASSEEDTHRFYSEVITPL